MNIAIVKGPIKNFKEQIAWCKEQFGPGVEVVGPTQAELYRWSYEIIGFGLRQIFFTNDLDYSFYVLRWS